MLVFRLFRIGKKNQPSFKVVVTKKTNPARGGRFVEQVGVFDPKSKRKVLNKERVQYWLKQGVKPSPTLHNLFIKEGILEGKKIPKHKKSKKPIDAGHSAELSRSPQGKAAAPKPAVAPAKEAAPAAAPVAPAIAPAEVAPQPAEAPKTE